MGYYDKEPNWTARFIVGGIALALVLGGAAAWGSFFTVEPGHTALVKDMRTGVLTETYGPGWHGKTPLLQEAIEIETRQQTETTVAVGASKDLQEITTEIAITYQPLDVAFLYNQLGVVDPGLGHSYRIDVGKVMPQAVQGAVKRCISIHLAEDMVRERNTVLNCVTDTLRFGPDGDDGLENQYRIAIQRVEITDFDFSDQFNLAIESKKVAEQQRDQQRAETERQKIIADGELYKRQQEASATKAQADADAYKVNVTASAQADAARMINAVLAENPFYIQYLYVQNGKNLMPQTLVTGGNSTANIPLLLNLVP